MTRIILIAAALALAAGCSRGFIAYHAVLLGYPDGHLRVDLDDAPAPCHNAAPTPTPTRW